MPEHPLAKLIPSSNDFSLRALEGDAKTSALEAAYEQGFTGCFDGPENEGWAKRIASYDNDEFLYDTPQKNKYFSEIFDSLSADEADGCHVYTKHAFEQFKASAAHPDSDDIFGVVQNHGICVDSSNVEMKAGLLGVRAADPLIAEILKYLPAHYAYAERGYCSHGWGMGSCARVNSQVGWCPATVLEIAGNELDWREEDAHEYAVARDWCRSGLPEWLKAYCREHYPWEESAVTRFDGGLDALRKLFQNKGQFHHGSNSTSASGKPNRWKRIGGHAQTACGGDWSDECLKWFADKGYRLDDGDFWVPNHQTWGRWSGQLDADLWPEHLWGPQPDGAWVCGAKDLLKRVSGYAYLPLLKGVPGAGPPVPKRRRRDLHGRPFWEDCHSRRD